MPRKSSSMGVLNHHITTSQHQIGLRSVIISQFTSNLLEIRNYIDINLKPQFIDYYIGNEYQLLDDYITSFTNNVKDRLLQFELSSGPDSDTQYLAQIASKIIDIVIKSRNEYKVNQQLIDTLKNYLSIYASGTSYPVPAPINGVINVDVSIDEKYLKYIEMFGTPSDGIFESDKLIQAENALS
tara:strand:+ start:1078 stop:1629 length:552 start_codon:yes stop_codon:yes gene_type:complete